MPEVAGGKERGKSSKKQKGWKLNAAVALLALLAIFVPELYLSQSGADLDDRRTRLSQLTVPPDGLKLYRFMLKEIPDIVSEIPCACCTMTLDECYRGGCPPT
ncbi:MAG: hypothetical protein GTO24_22975 [candidate division Zixibacteria bacterium]|nr:hypothetical protein [candidate division Zixibacteria bacterium]